MEKMVHDFTIDEILEILTAKIESYETWLEWYGCDELIMERIDELEKLYDMLRELKYYK